MPLTASAVIGGVGAASKIVTGFGQQAKANKMEERNKRPAFNVEQEYFDNRDLSASQAQHGLSEDALNYQRTSSERGLSASIGAALETGGGINSLTDLNDSYNRSVLQTAATDSELKNDRIKSFIDNNTTLAGQKTQKWVIDKYEPYKDTAKAIAQMRGAGQQNVQTGIGELTGVAASYATAHNNDDLLDRDAPIASGRYNSGEIATNLDYGTRTRTAPVAQPYTSIFHANVVPDADLDYEQMIERSQKKYK